MSTSARSVRGIAAAGVLGLAAAAAGWATSLKPIPLARASARAVAVVVGTAESFSCRRAATPSGRVRIFTDVEFRDLSVVRGAAPTRNLVLSIIGGTMDGRTLTVHGTPRFEAGKRYVLLLDAAEPLCGLVGWTQGVFRVERLADGTDRVFDHDGAPVAAVEGGRAVRGPEPMSLAAFLDAERTLSLATEPPRDRRGSRGPREEPR
jgi:hypothetical protein